MNWELRPLLGCGPLEFGMTPATVAKLIGAPRKEKLMEDSLREFRGQSKRNGYEVILTYRNDMLANAAFPFDDSDLNIFDINIFKEDPEKLIQTIAQINEGKYSLYLDQYIVFSKIALTLSDFYNDDNSNKWISIGTRESFSETISQLGEPSEERRI